MYYLSYGHLLGSNNIQSQSVSMFVSTCSPKFELEANLTPCSSSSTKAFNVYPTPQSLLTLRHALLVLATNICNIVKAYNANSMQGKKQYT